MQNKNKNYLKVLKFSLLLAYFSTNSFEFQLLPTKVPLPLIMTLLFRDFKDEHLSQVFTVLHLGTGS